MVTTKRILHDSTSFFNLMAHLVVWYRYHKLLWKTNSEDTLELAAAIAATNFLILILRDRQHCPQNKWLKNNSRLFSFISIYPINSFYFTTLFSYRKPRQWKISQVRSIFSPLFKLYRESRYYFLNWGLGLDSRFPPWRSARCFYPVKKE